MCVLDREGSRMLASRAVAAVQAAVYPTGYSNCLTSLCEPPSICHTGLNNVTCQAQSLMQYYCFIDQICLGVSHLVV